MHLTATAALVTNGSMVVRELPVNLGSGGSLHAGSNASVADAIWRGSELDPERAEVSSINCGSSSITFSVIDHETSSPILRGSVERIGQENAHLKCTAADCMGSQLLGAGPLAIRMHFGQVVGRCRVVPGAESKFAHVSATTISTDAEFTGAWPL